MSGRRAAATDAAVSIYRQTIAGVTEKVTKQIREEAFALAVKATGIHRTTLWRALRRQRKGKVNGQRRAAR